MQSVFRYLTTAALALGCVVAVLASAMSTAVPLLVARSTALIMGGTFHPLVGPTDTPDFVTAYLDKAVIDHLNRVFVGPVTNAVAVFTPEEFFPAGRLTFDESVAEGRVNLHRCLAASADCVFNDDGAVVPAVGRSTAPQVGDSFSVFGFSQSAVISSLAKQELIIQHVTGGLPVSFLLVANPMRPNGGVLMRGKGLPRIPILDISFIGASPTDSPVASDGSYTYPTADIATQYDGFGGDFPVRPLNLLALVNSLFAYKLLHGKTVDVPFEQARYQGREGDTSYYLIETDIVPILQPLAPLIPNPILKALDAPLRVIIEDAYDRDVSPGVPTTLSWWPTNDVFGLVGKLLESMPVAVDNLFEGFGLSRVLGTRAPGIYGVGGPDLPDEPGADAVPAVRPRQDALTSDGADEEYGGSAVDPRVIPAEVAEERAPAPDATGEEPTPAGPGNGSETAPVLGFDESGVATDESNSEDSEPSELPEPEPGPESSPADTGAADGDDSGGGTAATDGDDSGGGTAEADGDDSESGTAEADAA